ncbi:2-polyprenyl-6-methoxyphenol hydroxylase [Zafaria cholistanensis]|uniref:2-polyprenyl-6-methoxyphenol hydroxylase n=1 Tax=Zafaria cholistanensis TaxID=1682741 RepID=A0A5A7NUQ9_9MICC|nr:NAD(P)/FAD-dependent oxidoreductase [Zafaria cholistanensis]GER23571.1 2-polyprenyl-6-methoxyphenol hydroxylase [Zafaria cholistanensis]
MTDVDVAIAGAGPSGLALAILLAQRGVSVRVLEERAQPGTHSRAIGLHPPGLEVLDLAGVGAAAVEAGVRITSGVALHGPGPDGAVGSGTVRPGTVRPGTVRPGTVGPGVSAVASMDFGVLPGPHRYVLALPQTATQALLEERLALLDPGALRRGIRVEAFHPGPDGVCVRTSAGGAGPFREGGTPHGETPHGETPHGRPPVSPVLTAGSLTARFLVGADGVRSGTRDALGLPFRGVAHPDRYVMADYPDTTGFGPTAALFLHPEGIVESFPLPGGQRRWVARLPGGRATPPPPRNGTGDGSAPWEAAEGPAPDRLHEALAATIARRTGHSVEEAGAVPTVFGTARRRVPRMADGPVVLIGDAAHEVSPIGGQGMTLGLLDAAQLAGILCAALATTRGTGRGAGRGAVPDAAARAALERFSARRLRAARAAGRAAHLNMVLGRPLPGALLRGRDRAIGALVGRGAVHDAVARHFTMQG